MSSKPVKQNAQSRLITLMAAEGVEAIYGINDVFFHDFHRQAEASGIHMIGPRHEAAAAMMADAHTRMSGRSQACMAANGPGVMNLLPGIAIASFDNSPVVAVVSSRSMKARTRPATGFFQLAPQLEIFAPVTKYQATVTSAGQVDEIVHEAFRQANSGTPGPVFIEIPTDVMWEEARYGPAPAPDTYRAASTAPPIAVVESAARLLRAAKLPVILAGNAVKMSRSADALRQLARVLACPVINTWSGAGAFPETDSQLLRFGWGANDACSQADVVLAVGTSIGETLHFGQPPRWGAEDAQRWIHIERDAGKIGLNRKADVALVGDLAEILPRLTEALEPLGPFRTPPQLAEWRAAQDATRRAWCDATTDANPIHPGRAMMQLASVTPEQSVVVRDGGCTKLWHTFLTELRGPDCLWSGHFGHLGVGIPFAVGASFATGKSRPILVVSGDGAFGFHAMELETAVRHRLPIVVVVNFDQQWGMELVDFDPGEYDQIPDCRFSGSRLDGLATALGAHGEYVDRLDELTPALQRAFAAGKPAVVQIVTDSLINSTESALPCWEEFLSWWQADGYGYGLPGGAEA
ncbi:MAG: thiamine pyrophosphate-binding protein [Rhodospirillaceae bacterium]|nr:thiamine pyrophosphate-binding protein [Rhodospirillaceae bacterium]